MPRKSFVFFWSFVVTSALAAPSKHSLLKSYKAAKAKSEILQAGLEQLAQVDAKESQVKGGIYPNLSFNLGHQIQPLPADPVAQQFSPQHQTSVYFSLTQPIFRGLREWYGLRQIQALKAAHELTQDQLAIQLFQELATTYLQILTLEQDLKNLGEQSTLYGTRVGELTARARRGESSQTDLVTAEATQASLGAEVQLVQGQLEAARENFHFLTGLSRDSELQDPDALGGSSFTSVEKYLERIEQRPDIMAAMKRVEAAEKGVTMAWGGHSPSIDLGANYYLKRPGFLSDLNWDVGVRLTLPLFEGGATQAKVTEAVSKRKEAEIDLARIRRAAQQEIHSLHRRLKARMNQLSSLKKSAELSSKNATLLQRDYRKGLARNIDVQLALTESRVTQRALDQAHFAAQLEMFQLQAASSLLPGQQKEPN